MPQYTTYSAIQLTNNARFGSMLSPFTSHDPTVITQPLYGRGGLKIISSMSNVAGLGDTQSWIPAARRNQGSIIYSKQDGKYYKDTLGESGTDSSSGYEAFHILNGEFDQIQGINTFSAGILVTSSIKLTNAAGSTQPGLYHVNFVVDNDGLDISNTISVPSIIINDTYGISNMGVGTVSTLTGSSFDFTQFGGGINYPNISNNFSINNDLYVGGDFDCSAYDTWVTNTISAAINAISADSYLGNYDFNGNIFTIATHTISNYTANKLTINSHTFSGGRFKGNIIEFIDGGGTNPTLYSNGGTLKTTAGLIVGSTLNVGGATNVTTLTGSGFNFTNFNGTTTNISSDFKIGDDLIVVGDITASSITASSVQATTISASTYEGISLQNFDLGATFSAGILITDGNLTATASGTTQYFNSIHAGNDNVHQVGHFEIFGNQLNDAVQVNTVIDLNGGNPYAYMNRYYLGDTNYLYNNSSMGPIFNIGNQDDLIIQSIGQGNKVGLIFSNGGQGYDVRFGFDLDEITSTKTASITTLNTFKIDAGTTVIPNKLIIGGQIGTYDGFYFEDNYLKLNGSDNIVIQNSDDAIIFRGSQGYIAQISSSVYIKSPKVTASTISGSNYELGQSDETGSLNNNRIYFEGGTLYAQTVSGVNFEGIVETDLGYYKFQEGIFRVDDDGDSHIIIDTDGIDGDRTLYMEIITSSVKIMGKNCQFGSLQNQDSSFIVNQTGNLDANYITSSGYAYKDGNGVVVAKTELGNIIDASDISVPNQNGFAISAQGPTQTASLYIHGPSDYTYNPYVQIGYTSEHTASVQFPNELNGCFYVQGILKADTIEGSSGGEVTLGNFTFNGDTMSHTAFSARNIIQVDGVNETANVKMFVGDLQCQSLKETSLRQYKHAIMDIQSPQLQKIRLLNPVTFIYNTDIAEDINDPASRQAGFIAEDIELIYPEICWYTNGELGGVQYQRLTSYLTKGIQQLDEQNTKLKQRVSSLQQRLEKLQKLLIK